MYQIKPFLEICLWVAVKTRSTHDELNLLYVLPLVDPNVGGEDSLMVDALLKCQKMLAEGQLTKMTAMGLVSLLNQYPLMEMLYMTYLALYPDHPDAEAVPKTLPSLMEFIQEEWDIDY